MNLVSKRLWGYFAIGDIASMESLDFKDTHDGATLLQQGKLLGKI
jgi:hypothetical protein